MRDKKDSKPHIGFNFIVMDNACYHIHDWFYFLLILILYFLLNYIIGYGWNKNYFYIISVYLGLSLSELLKFRSDIFRFKKPCCPKD